ncbi:MAG TPA: ParB N-terminal domain-containing protein [Gemmata sp.]
MATKTKPKPAPAPAPSSEVQAPAPPLPPVMPRELLGEVPLASIKACPFNVRRAFPDSDVAGLAESIKAEGLITRLIVRPVGLPGEAPTFAGGKWSGLSHYELADGERRLRALTLLDETHTNDAAGTKVPVVIRPLTDEQVLAMMVTTREQSRDLAVSELVTGYTELRARKPDDAAVAAAVGKPVAHVRSVLRLARLPAWALAAIDAGHLPRATAELVARVPGELSRKRCAVYVLENRSRTVVDDAWCDRMLADLEADGYEPAGEYPAMSYRDTKELIRDCFQKELKGAPFSLKVVYTLPDCEPGHERSFPHTCDECPKRAGNDPEALAEGTRADVCLDPECYREKVSAYRNSEIAKAAEKGIEHLDTDERFAPKLAPRGYCDPTTDVWQTELHADFPIGAKRRDEPLKQLLGKAEVQRYMAFAADGKPRVLVKTADARKVLQDVGLLKKPEKAKAAEKKPSLLVSKSVPAAMVRSTKPDGPSDLEVSSRALVTAARALEEYSEDNFGQLAEISDSGTDPAESALRLVCRAWAYDYCLCSGAVNRPVLGAVFPRAEEWIKKPDVAASDLKMIDVWPAARCLAFLLRLAIGAECFDDVNTDTARALLAFAELDWSQLQEQARRELTGGEPAEAKVAKAEAAPAEGGVSLKGAAQAHAQKFDMEDLPGPVFDALEAIGIVTLPVLLERLGAEPGIPTELPLRNRLVAFFTNNKIASYMWASHAADQIATHFAAEAEVRAPAPEEPEPAVELPPEVEAEKQKALAAARKNHKEHWLGESADGPACVEVRRCRVCGCTDENCAKCVAKIGMPCEWWEEDLCTACVRIHAFEGEWLGDLVSAGGTIEKLVKQIDGASVCEKFQKPIRSPVSVRPFVLGGPVQPAKHTGLFVYVGGCGQYGHRQFDAAPLYTPEAFRVQFPGREMRLQPADPQTDEDRKNYYFGVRLKVGKDELVIGPPDEERKLTTKDPRELAAPDEVPKEPDTTPKTKGAKK